MHPWSQCNAFLTHESPETPFKAKSISDYLGMCISSRIVVKAFRSEGLERKTPKWHSVIRHALLSNYGLLIAQDSIVGWNVEESHGISSLANFSQKPFSSKVDQRSLQSAYPNNDLCEMRITASSFTDPPRITNELLEARVLVLNDIEARARPS